MRGTTTSRWTSLIRYRTRKVPRRTEWMTASTPRKGLPTRCGFPTRAPVRGTRSPPPQRPRAAQSARTPRTAGGVSPGWAECRLGHAQVWTLSSVPPGPTGQPPPTATSVAAHSLHRGTGIRGLRAVHSIGDSDSVRPGPAGRAQRARPDAAKPVAASATASPAITPNARRLGSPAIARTAPAAA